MMRMNGAFSQMMIPKSERNRNGFTLVETLVALLIFVALTTVVAMGIPVAFKTYKQVLDSSNAQLAIATTTAALRDELGLAIDAKELEGKWYYQLSDQSWATIDNPSAGSKGLVKTLYRNESPSSFNPIFIGSTPLIPESTFASAIGSEQPQIRITKAPESTENGSITFDKTNGFFNVPNLTVFQGVDPVESIDTPFKIRAVFGPFSD